MGLASDPAGLVIPAPPEGLKLGKFRGAIPMEGIEPWQRGYHPTILSAAQSPLFPFLCFYIKWLAYLIEPS